MKKIVLFALIGLCLLAFPIRAQINLLQKFAGDTGGSAWTSGGPNGGYVRCIAIAPSNRNILYAGTANGMYKSLDGGANWARAGLVGTDIGVVRVDSGDPTLVYAGSNVSNGFFKSTAGGASWTPGTIGFILALDIDPNNSQVLWAGTSTGRIYRSDDRGGSWVEKHHELYADELWTVDVWINSIVVDPENSATVFAGLGSTWTMNGGFSGFTKSVNNGETWTPSHVGATGPWDFGTSLVITPAGYAPQTLYIIATGDSDFEYANDVFQSTDKGETWTEIYMYQESSYSNAWKLTIDPQLSNWLYVSNTNPSYPLLAWEDVEKEWWNAGTGLPEAPNAVAVDPDNAYVLYAGCTSGVYKSTNGWSTWALSNNGLNNSYINDIAINPLSSASVFAAVTSKDIMQSSANGGDSWGNFCPDFQDGFTAITMDPHNPAVMFAGSSYGDISRTSNSGVVWTQVYNSSAGDVEGVWVHPANSNIVLALIENDGVRRSADGGLTWTKVYDWNWPDCLAFDPNDANVIYLGVERLGYVFRSTDAGLNWTNISPQSQWANGVYGLVVDANSDVYAALTDYQTNGLGGIWKWSQTSWTHVYHFSTTTLTALAIDRNTSPGILYAGTSSAGIFRSENGGVNWSEFNDGLGSMAITELEISVSAPKLLYAGSAYGGVWSRDVTATVLNGIQVLSPNGGEIWTGSSTHDIAWTSTGIIANVNIDYSTNNGSNWTSVVIGTPNDGTYSWIVPNYPSTTCLVRVSDATNAATLDTSNAVFTILANTNSYSISGTILVGSSPLAGVVMSGLTSNPTTNASGFYSGTVTSGWSGTVTPTLIGYTFTPATRTYTNVIANSTNQNYTATVVSRLDLIGTWDGQGVYYRNSLTGLWVKLATPAALVTAGDLDGDGIDDLIGIWPGQGGVWAKYSQSGSWAQLSSTARDISAGDMNGDGRDDLLATWDGQGVYYRNSIGGAWVKMATPAEQVTAGDLDGDGKDDVIGIWPSQGGVWVKYSQSGLWAQLSSTAIDIAAGDMNGDGREDLVATWDGQGVYYKDSISGAWVKMATPATLVAAGDLDGDAKADVIGIWPGQGGVWVKYSQSGSWAQLSSTARHIAAGLMRGGAGSSTALFAEPFGGVAAGPKNLGYQDMAAAGPGDWNFQCQEENNLNPQEDMESELRRVPGPGEYGFQCLEQKNLVPGSEIKRASKDKEQR